MKKYKIVFSESAVLELGQIYAYISHKLKAKNAARKTVAEIKRRIADLFIMPARNPLARPEGLVMANMRVMYVGSYEVFYVIQSDIVKIAKITYGRRDIKLSDFPPLDDEPIVCEEPETYNVNEKM